MGKLGTPSAPNQQLRSNSNAVWIILCTSRDASKHLQQRPGGCATKNLAWNLCFYGLYKPLRAMMRLRQNLKCTIYRSLLRQVVSTELRRGQWGKETMGYCYYSCVRCNLWPAKHSGNASYTASLAGSFGGHRIPRKLFDGNLDMESGVKSDHAQDGGTIPRVLKARDWKALAG